MGPQSHRDSSSLLPSLRTPAELKVPSGQFLKIWGAGSVHFSHALPRTQLFGALPMSLAFTSCWHPLSGLNATASTERHKSYWTAPQSARPDSCCRHIPVSSTDSFVWAVSYLSKSAFLYPTLYKNNRFHLGTQEYREKKEHIVVLILKPEDHWREINKGSTAHKGVPSQPSWCTGCFSAHSPW